MRVDRVLGELGGRRDDQGSRLAYGGYIEGLVRRYSEEEGRKEFEEKWDRVRRGWYLGREGFRERLIEMVDEVIQGKRKETYKGDEIQAHDEAEAGRLLEEASGVAFKIGKKEMG